MVYWHEPWSTVLHHCNKMRSWTSKGQTQKQDFQGVLSYSLNVIFQCCVHPEQNSISSIFPPIWRTFSKYIFTSSAFKILFMKKRNLKTWTQHSYHILFSNDSIWISQWCWCVPLEMYQQMVPFISTYHASLHVHFTVSFSTCSLPTHSLKTQCTIFFVSRHLRLRVMIKELIHCCSWVRVQMMATRWWCSCSFFTVNQGIYACLIKHRKCHFNKSSPPNMANEQHII